ncbi:MAG: hypothetical protein HDT08_04175 [Bacteroidales bacterium]|nr:hypothetical protein [Bacteroidales bacterium]
MIPKFTTPCFIRKNTPELRKKLEELGYTFLPNGYAEWNIPIEELPYLQCNTERNLSYYIGKNGWMDGIDCGENEQLFLALAALREDSDKFQWFCDDEEGEYKSLFFCKYDDVEKHIHNEMDGWDCEGFHKATPAELIEHFKEK